MPGSETYPMPVDGLNRILAAVPEEAHFRLHLGYNLTVTPEWEIPRRINVDYHLLFIRSGSGAYDFGGRREEFAKGKILFVTKGLAHSAARVSSVLPSLIALRFGIYANRSGELLDIAHEPFYLSYVPRDFHKFQQLFEQLYSCYIFGSSHQSRVLSSALLSQILAELGGGLPYDAAFRMDPRIRRATEYIEQNLLQRFSSEKIAQAAGLSPRYLTKLFRNGTGMTPLCYYIKFRMDYARFLLEESGLSVKQAALTLGYPDPYSFSKQFKKAMGYPPSRCQADI